MRSQRRLVRPISAVNLEPNTFIGGVATEIPTKAALATKLNIAESGISYFSVVGSDVEARIDVNYSIPIGFGTPQITYYLDEIDGKALHHGGFRSFDYSNIKTVSCKNVSSIDFLWISGSFLLETIKFENLTIVPDQGFKGFQNPSNVKEIYIPNVTALGTTTGNNGVFDGINLNAQKTKIICHPSLKTNNSGGYDGDLIAAQSNGAKIFFKENNIAPSNPTINSLEIGFKYFMLKDNGINANPIRYYEVYKDNVLQGEFYIGEFIRNLQIGTTYSNYSFIAVDLSFNKGEKTTIVFTTKDQADANFDITNLISYYTMDDGSVDVIKDVFALENFVNGNATYLLPNQIGKIATAFKNTGIAFIKASNVTDLGANLTINFWRKREAGGAGDNRTIVDHGANRLNTGFGVWENGSGYMGIRVNNENAAYKAEMFAPLDTYVMVTATYDGATIKLYLNGVLQVSYPKTNVPNPTTERYLFKRRSYGEWISGGLDEVSLWNAALSAARINDLYNNGNGLTI